MKPAGHVHAQSWLDAGFEATQVDMAGQKLIFKRMANDSPRYAMHGLADSPREFEPAENKQPRRHPAFGALKGMFWIEPGYDLTQPAIEEDWEEAFDKKWDEAAEMSSPLLLDTCAAIWLVDGLLPEAPS